MHNLLLAVKDPETCFGRTYGRPPFHVRAFRRVRCTRFVCSTLPDRIQSEIGGTEYVYNAPMADWTLGKEWVFAGPTPLHIAIHEPPRLEVVSKGSGHRLIQLVASESPIFHKT